MSPNPVDEAKAFLARHLEGEKPPPGKEAAPAAQEVIEEVDVTTPRQAATEGVQPWGIHHAVGGVMVGCFSLPFLPVLIILALASLPAIIFASFIF